MAETGIAMESDRGQVGVDRDRCIVCGACTSVCPREALIAEGSTLIVMQDRCRPCGRAALVCPVGALTCPGALRVGRYHNHGGTV